MTDLWAHFRSSLRFSDLLDILIISFVVYRVLVLIKGTRAMQMLTGLGLLGIGYILSSHFELFATHWVLSHFFDALVLLVIVLFQDDLRRALTHVGKNPFLSGFSSEEDRELIEEVARASTQIAQSGNGALIVLERDTGLKNFIDTGSRIDSKVKSELLCSIFQSQSPVHDGAVIITGGRIAAAGCFLPLSKDQSFDKKWGTRHRAALGLTEDSDAVVILISEEQKEVFLVKSGKITTKLSEAELRESLFLLLGVGRSNAGTKGISRGLRAWLTDRSDS